MVDSDLCLCRKLYLPIYYETTYTLLRLFVVLIYFFEVLFAFFVSMIYLCGRIGNKLGINKQ